MSPKSERSTIVSSDKHCSTFPGEVSFETATSLVLLLIVCSYSPIVPSTIYTVLAVEATQTTDVEISGLLSELSPKRTENVLRIEGMSFSPIRPTKETTHDPQAERAR